MIEAMVFDAGGVLMASNNTVTDDLKQTLGMSHEQVTEVWDKYIPLFGAGKMTEEKFWSHLSSDYGIRDVSPAENLLGRAFAANLVKNDELFEYIGELKKRGLKLAVLSDTIEPHANAMREAGLFEPFDSVFLSYEVGYRKPNPFIYHAVLNSLGLNAPKVGFTDDNPDNVAGAMATGIRSVTFENVAKLKQAMENWL